MQLFPPVHEAVPSVAQVADWKHSALVRQALQPAVALELSQIGAVKRAREQRELNGVVYVGILVTSPNGVESINAQGIQLPLHDANGSVNVTFALGAVAVARGVPTRGVCEAA